MAGTDNGWRYASTNDRGRVIGEHHHSAKLSEADIELILVLREAGLSYRQISEKFDTDPRVSKSMVCAVCTGARRRQTTMGHKRVQPRPTPCPTPAEGVKGP